MYMNKAQSNNRANRFDLLRKLILTWEWQTLYSPDPRQHQLVITAWVMRLLEPGDNLSVYPIQRASNPREAWTYARFSNEWWRLLINGVGSRGAGARVLHLIGYGENPDLTLQEAIEAMVVSLRYPNLDAKLVKQEHRELLRSHGYLN